MTISANSFTIPPDVGVWMRKFRPLPEPIRLRDLMNRCYARLRNTLKLSLPSFCFHVGILLIFISLFISLSKRGLLVTFASLMSSHIRAIPPRSQTKKKIIIKVRTSLTTADCRFIKDLSIGHLNSWDLSHRVHFQIPLWFILQVDVHALILNTFGRKHKTGSLFY